MGTGDFGGAAYDVNGFLARKVPITRAMGIRFESFGPDGVVMSAPLEPNLNDKGIAFGGSIVSILALSCWALADLVLRLEGLDADVIVASSRIDFRLPVTGRIVARCPLPPAEEVTRFCEAFRARGRARLRLEARIATGDGAAAVFHGHYIARRKAGG